MALELNTLTARETRSSTGRAKVLLAAARQQQPWGIGVQRSHWRRTVAGGAGRLSARALTPLWRAALCVVTAVVVSLASCGVASADYSLPNLDPTLQWVLECLCHQMASSDVSTQPTMQPSAPSAPSSTPPTRFGLAALQLPDSALLAAAPEPPATSSLPSVYEWVCSVADEVFHLNSDGASVLKGVLEHVAEKGSLSAGLVINMGAWAVSRTCHDYAPKVVPKLINGAKQWLGLS
jgi:hypothetical protein